MHEPNLKSAIEIVSLNQHLSIQINLEVGFKTKFTLLSCLPRGGGAKNNLCGISMV
jgi:hypothetical protein